MGNRVRPPRCGGQGSVLSNAGARLASISSLSEQPYCMWLVAPKKEIKAIDEPLVVFVLASVPS